jgi:hypothetical protein
MKGLDEDDRASKIRYALRGEFVYCRQETDCRLATQCVANVTAAHQDWICQIKLPDEFHIVNRVTGAEI